MSMLTITAKGQVTLRKEVLKHLGVKPGDKVEVDRLPNGRIEVKAVRPKGDLSKFFGSLAQESGPHLTMEEMNKVISDAWAGKR